MAPNPECVHGAGVPRAWHRPLHPTLPVFGEPFEVPFDFPLFQAAASVVMEAGVEDDTAMRVTGLACFLLTALLLFSLGRHGVRQQRAAPFR